MRSLAPLVLALAVAATACGASEPYPESTPAAVVAGWAEAVESRDFDAATDAVFEASLIIVLAVENDLPAVDTARMLTDGIGPVEAAAYWSSFRDDFVSFAGIPISALKVGASNEAEAGGERWAFVAVSAQENPSTPILARQVDGWVVDLVATLAHGFVEPLQSYLASIPDDASGATIRDEYAAVVVPAMWAAIDGGDNGDDFARRALALIDAVES